MGKLTAKSRTKTDKEMKKDKYKPSCIWCKHYDDDAQKCTHAEGLLRNIYMSESMSIAEHDCKEFSETYLRLTPASILDLALDDFNVNLPFDQVKLICERFIEGLKKHGYIEDVSTD